MKTRFKDVYRDMFEQQVKKADMGAVFTEYVWDMNWCDPCAADPLFFEELRSLGVFWFSETPPDLVPGRGRPSIVPPMGVVRDVFDTRTHVGYEAQHYPEDLVLQATADRNNYQVGCERHHTAKSEDNSCPANEEYRQQVSRRQDQEVRQLADLTGWKLADSRGRMNLRTADATYNNKWRKKL